MSCGDYLYSTIIHLLLSGKIVSEFKIIKPKYCRFKGEYNNLKLSRLFGLSSVQIYIKIRYF